MSEYGIGQFHVHWTDNSGRQHRKAYRQYDDADKARNFLDGLGIYADIDMNSRTAVWNG